MRVKNIEERGWRTQKNVRGKLLLESSFMAVAAHSLLKNKLGLCALTAVATASVSLIRTE